MPKASQRAIQAPEKSTRWVRQLYWGSGTIAPDGGALLGFLHEEMLKAP